MLAVFIRNFQFQSQFYSMQGKWFHMSTRQVSFYIPKLFTQQDIDPLMPYLPNKEVESEALHKLQEMDKGVPREIGAPLIEKLQSLHSASDEVYREHAERIDRVHALVAHESRTTEITLLDIAMVVLQKQNVNDLTNIMLWTVHKALIRNPNFRPQPGSTHRGHPLWIVNPVRMMRGFEQVKAWLREYLEGQIAQATSPDASSTVVFNEKDSQSSNPVPSFLRKAKRLVESSRASRNITAYAGLGPLTDRSATDEPPLHHAKSLTAFTIFEMEIIRYLKSWCLSWDIPTAGSVWALGPLLLGATESYEGRTLDEKTAFLFLQEMGIIAPWENRYVYERNVRFPKHDNSSEIAETRVVGSLSQQRETRRGGSLENSLEDSLEGLRKDWGDLPVYCIDDASAREIDDGISLERLNGEDSIFWIHIHVANPSAFIGPDSGISRYAADLLETTYLPEKVYPMLNSTLTESYFSLANHRPVLTLSAKVNVDGEILATDITPGWIHNTKKITPTRLDRQLGSDGDPPSKPSQMLQVGRPMDFERRNAAEDQLSHSELAELRTLHELGIARRIKRSGGEGITQFSHGTVPNPLVYLDKGGIIPMFNPRLGRQFICDPSIAWEACEADVTGELALGRTQNFVADIMLIAGEVAGRWCAERGMPIVYRGTIRDPAPRLNLENYKKNTIDYSMRVKGYVPTRFYRELNRALGQSVGRSVPFPHAVLRTEVYTKATSPLRRYPDLLNHWQIQAALLHEARHGKGSLIGSTDDSYLPFSRSKLDAMIPGIELRQLVMKHLTKQSKVHWIMQLLHRAFHFKEAVLPELFDVLVHIEPRTLLKEGNAVGYTRQLSGLDADLVENDTTKREGGIRMGDRWQCKMDGVDTYAARLKMWPLKLMEREVWGVAIPATGAA